MSCSHMSKKNKGFTLIEMLVVIAVMALIVSGTINLLSILIKNRIKAQTMNILTQEGNKIIAIAGRTMNSASAITDPDPNNDPGTQPHCGTDSGPSPVTPTADLHELEIEDINGNKIRLSCEPANASAGTNGYVNLNTQQLLTNENITLSDCSITCYNSISGKGALVTLSLVLTVGKGAAQMSDIFTNTFVLRNYKKL